MILRSSPGVLGPLHWTWSHGVDSTTGLVSLGVEATIFKAYILSVSWTVSAASMIHVWTKDLNPTLWLLDTGLYGHRLLGIERLLTRLAGSPLPAQELVQVLCCPAMDDQPVVGHRR